MQAASSFFLPLSLFLVAFFLSTPQPVFQSFISLSLYRDSSGSQTIHFKRMERFSASIRGENWLRRGHNRQVAVVGSLWEKVYSICICSTWLMCGKTAETHLKCRFFYFSWSLPPNRIPSSRLIGRFTYWLRWLRIWAIPTQLLWQLGRSWQGHGDLAWRANFLTCKSFFFLCLSPLLLFKGEIYTTLQYKYCNPNSELETQMAHKTG